MSVTVAIPVASIRVGRGCGMGRFGAMGGGNGFMGAACAGGEIRQLWQSQKRDQRQHRDNSDVLKQQNRKAGLPAVASHQPFFIERLQHDRCGRQRQHRANCQSNGPRLPKGHGNARYDRCRAQHLKAAQAQQPRPHLPKHPWLQLKPNEKQHHHNAKLGKVLDRNYVNTDRCQRRADNNSCNQVAQNRAQPEPGGNWDSDNTGHKEDKGKQQEICHGSGLLNQGQCVVVQCFGLFGSGLVETIFDQRVQQFAIPFRMGPDPL